jgi:hypothetical protein
VETAASVAMRATAVMVATEATQRLARTVMAVMVAMVAFRVLAGPAVAVPWEQRTFRLAVTVASVR